MKDRNTGLRGRSWGNVFSEKDKTGQMATLDHSQKVPPVVWVQEAGITWTDRGAKELNIMI